MCFDDKKLICVNLSNIVKFTQTTVQKFSLLYFVLVNQQQKVSADVLQHEKEELCHWTRCTTEQNHKHVLREYDR